MRALDAATQEALRAAVVQWIALVRLEFDSGTVAWHSAWGTIPFEGYEYQGVGVLGSVDRLRESEATTPGVFRVGVSGVDEGVVAMLLGEPYLGRRATVHYALMRRTEGYAPRADDTTTTVDASAPTADAQVYDGVAVVGAPILAFQGTMDEVDGYMGSTASFTVTIRSRLADWDRRRVSRYTHQEQIARYPGDRGLEFVEQMAEAELVWPSRAFFR